MKNSFYLILFLFAISNFSCSSDNSEFIESFWVNSEKIESLSWGGESIRCLSVQENEFINENDWRPLCQGIEGFSEQYEEGYIYQLSIIKIEVDNPPADGSSIKYVLEEIISKALDK